jgi:N-acylneuraminate cytidylyltransferase
MIVGFLPIRSGSKSIPNKNIKNFCGFPLAYWTIEALNKCKKIDKIIVALDSKEYEATLRKYNFEKVEFYHRKNENAQDKSSTESVMIEFLESENGEKYKESDLFVLVQATSPFTQSTDIEKAIEKMKDDQHRAKVKLEKQK